MILWYYFLLVLIILHISHFKFSYSFFVVSRRFVCVCVRVCLFPIYTVCFLFVLLVWLPSYKVTLFFNTTIAQYCFCFPRSSSASSSFAKYKKYPYRLLNLLDPTQFYSFRGFLLCFGCCCFCCFARIV